MTQFFKKKSKTTRVIISLLLTVLAIVVASVGFYACGFIRMYKTMTAGEPNTIAQTDTIPFELHQNTIIVKGKINGKEYDFIVDTGAPSIIWEEVAQELKLAKAKASSTSQDSNDKEQKMDFYQVDKMSVGGAEMTNVNMASLSTLSEEVKCYATGGIIGGNFLMHYVWQIDYTNNRLIVSSDLSKLTIPKEAVKVQALVTKPQGQLTISNFPLLGKKPVFIVDTGFKGFINLSKNDWNLKATEKKSKSVEGYGYSNLGVGGRTKITTYALQTDLDTPMGIIKDAVMQVNSESSLLGNAFFSQFKVVTIDYLAKDAVVYFNPAKNIVSDPMTYGFSPIYKQGASSSVVVGSIYKNSEAEKKGLKIGDPILALNGKDLTQLNFLDHCANIYSGVPSFKLAGESVTITVLQDGEKKEYELKKYSLFE